MLNIFKYCPHVHRAARPLRVASARLAFDWIARTKTLTKVLGSLYCVLPPSLVLPLGLADFGARAFSTIMQMRFNAFLALPKRITI